MGETLIKFPYIIDIQHFICIKFFLHFLHYSSHLLYWYNYNQSNLIQVDYYTMVVLWSNANFRLVTESGNSAKTGYV